MKNAGHKNKPLRRALVTGASGFVGGHLARRLVRDGWEVHALLRSAGQRSQLSGWEAQVQFHVLDGTSEGLGEILKSAAPQVVFHLASLFIAEHKTPDVARLVESNVRFAAQLAEAMTMAGVTRLVNTGSSWEHFRGDEPANLYAATKRAAAEIFRAYAATTPMRVVTLKLFDTYGPEDPRPKLIPMLIRAAASGERLALSPGRQKLDLVHVDDVVSAYIAAAGRLLRPPGRRKPVEEFAVSSGRAWTLRQIVGFISEACGQPIQVGWGSRPYRLREVMKPWRGGQPLPKWKTVVNLRDGIQSLVDTTQHSRLDGSRPRKKSRA